MANKKSGVPYNRKYRKQKRTDAQRERDYVDIARWYLQGHTQYEISLLLKEKYGYQLTHQMISIELKVIHKRWLESALVDFNAAKSKELARLDEIERAAWEGWHNSLEKKEKTQIEDVQDNYSGSQAGNSYTRKKGKKTIEERDGDPRFLDRVAWCIDQRCKILGLYAPERQAVDISWREEARKAGVNPEDIKEKVRQEFIEAASRGLTQEQKDQQENQE